MRCFHSSRGVLSACSLALVAFFVISAALAREVFVTHTNWVDRPITNEIEVRMPKNVFVSEYHTNWVSVYQTNRSQVFLTNQVLVQLVRTNFVTAYRTNFQALNVTNWETVQVLKTNWIRRPATNVVKIDAPLASAPVASSAKNSAVASPPVASSVKSLPVALPPVASSVKSSPAVQSVPTSADGWVVETTAPPTKIGSSQWEIQLRVRSSKDATSPLVKNWRIEHVDAGVINFKQGQVLTLELTPGRYQIEASVQRKAAAPVQLLRALLTVTPDGTSLQPSSGKDFAAAQ